MAAVGVEEDPAVQAARILLTLRNRKLVRWPEWVDKEPSAAAAAEVVEVRWPLEGWPKRQRRRRNGNSGWQAAMALPKLGLVVASGSRVASASGEERDRSPAPSRWRDRPVRDELMAAARRPGSPAYYSGSGPSTSAAADRKARPHHAAVEAAKAKAASSPAPVAAPAKEQPMKAPSPETPLDFTNSRSGASSSGDDAARPPSKRRAPGAVGSGGGSASSSDEGCSSPDKRARVDAGDGDAEKAISEPKTRTPDCEKGVKFEFDLNMPCPEDDECPGLC